MLALALACFASAATCPLDSSAYVFLHPYFAGKHWAHTAANTNVILPDTVCKLKPSVFSVSQHARYNTAAFIGHDNKLYVMPCESYTPSCPCCAALVQFAAPKAVSVPHLTLGADSPLFVLSQARTSSDTACVVVALAELKLEVLTVSTASGSIVGRDTLTLSQQTAGQTIAGIHGALNQAAYADTAVWVTGSSGMIRSIPVSGGTLGSELVYDIASSENVLCYGSARAGCSSGSIYELQAGAFTPVASGAGSALHFIKGDVAAGDNGTLRVRQGSSWDSYTVGSASIRYAELVTGTGGLSAELLDNNWRYQLYSYADDPTRIDSVFPAYIHTYVNTMAYDYDADTALDVSLCLVDPNGNHEVPAMQVRSGSSVTYLHVNGPDTITQRDPDNGCAIGKVVLKVDTLAAPIPYHYAQIRLHIEPGQITVDADCRRGVNDFACGACMWQPFAFSTVVGWQEHDTLTIESGGDWLRFINYNFPPTGVKPGAGRLNLREIVSCRMQPGRAYFCVEQVPGAARLTEILLLDSRGRTIACIPVAAQSLRVGLPAPVASGIVHARYRFSDGSSGTGIIPLIR